MKHIFSFSLSGILILSLLSSCDAKPAQEPSETIPETTEREIEKSLILGAERMDDYLPLLKGKSVGVITNHTALIQGIHIVDTLLSQGVNITRVFAPEHGFRGDADAGAKILDGKDEKTGLPIFSLYGKNRKPTSAMLEGLDILLFDIQDAGVRFYTYISTMHLSMEAAAENNIAYMVLDRPNPNGSYVDGPIRAEDQKSFVGMHPIPIVHGMTVGELAHMINGEGWLENGIQADLTVIEMENWKHDLPYSLPVKPSPNLPTDLSITLYPSICLFEGTVISVGRGTYEAFQQIGHPSFSEVYTYSFTPESIEGMASNPKYKDKACYGISFKNQEVTPGLTLKYLIDFYNQYQGDEPFFNSYFSKLAGTTQLQEQIENGLSEQEIKQSWQVGLSEFKKKRENYLIYP